MMASPHSFKRHSHSSSIAQLPLPPSLNASASQRPVGGVTVRSSSPSMGAQPLPPSASPTTAHFPHMHPSSTHAGGIQPSSSFFRPSRPNHPTDPHPHDPDIYPLAQLSPTKRHSFTQSSTDIHDPEPEADETLRHFTSLKRFKQSREPLLPIGGAPSTPRRPSQTTSPIRPALIASPHKKQQKTVRNSFERVLRGMSLESIRRKSNPSPSPGPASTHPFDPKFDEEALEHVDPSPAQPPSPNLLRQNTHPPHPPPRPSSSIPSPSPAPSSSPSLHSSASPSPVPSFNPVPPTAHPPLSHTPYKSPTGHWVRRYQLHPSRNRFFASGRLLTGGDSPWAFYASAILVLGLAGVWFGTTAVFWWRGSSGRGPTHERDVGPGGKAVVLIGAYLAALVISNMFVTATTDPGILPRGLDLDPPYPATSPSDGGVRAPMPRDLKVRNDVVRVKYCPTCKTYRPPRSSHCKICDNCVDGCDHHCQWVNNCIGRRNYTSFFVLLFSATTMLVLIICTSALHLYLLTRHEDVSFRGALGRGVGSAVAFCVASAVIWPVAALLSYHMRLLLLNVTTIEQIRNQAHKTLAPDGAPPPNPFSHGEWRRNLLAVLCRPQGYSWLDGHGVAVEDRRGVNPGNGGGVGVGAGVGGRRSGDEEEREGERERER